MANETATYKGTTYKNGQLPKKWLKLLDGDNNDTPGDRAQLRTDAADAWNRARRAVKNRTGITLTVVGWYRPIAQQEAFFLDRYYRAPSGGIDRRKYNGVWYARHPNEAPAAIPGQSNHGLATAIDVRDFGSFGTSGNTRRAKTIAILREYGWTDHEGQSIGEPWHLDYDPSKNKHRNPPKEPDMDKHDKQVAKRTKDVAEKTLELMRKLDAGLTPRIDYEHVKEGKITNRTAQKFQLTLLHRMETEIKALRAAVETLSKSYGVEPSKIQRSITTAVNKAVADTRPIPDED